jgi:hypothetical protein
LAVCEEADGVRTGVAPPPGNTGDGLEMTEKADREFAASMRSIVRRID